MKILKYYDSLLEADIDREELAANGIKAIVLNENTSTVLPFSYADPSLRPYIVVSGNDTAKAAGILGLDTDEGRREKQACPCCGSEDLVFGFSDRNKSGKRFTKILLVTGLLFGVHRGGIKEVFTCRECGKEFKP